MELILVRHGESEGNVKSVLYGQTDYPLTAKGRNQIPHIIDNLKHFKVDKIFSSPLIRAKAIGDAISEAYELPLETDERLMEINFGDYDNVDRSQVIDQVGEDGYYSIISFLDHRAIPGGEHQDDFLSRVRQFVDQLLGGDDGTYILTAHYGVIKAILNYLLDYDKKRFREMAIKPGAIVRVAIKQDRNRFDELIQTYDRV